jgi:hypothetical protein
MFWVMKPEAKRRLGRPSLIWEGNIKLCFKSIVFKGVDWSNMSQDTDDERRAVVNTVMNLRFSKKLIIV